jgi:glycosyltransferase involved in cell wall biosynthesis
VSSEVEWREVSDRGALSSEIESFDPGVVVSFHQDEVQAILESRGLPCRMVEISHCSHPWARDVTRTSKVRVDRVVSVSESAFRFAASGIENWSGEHRLIWNGVAVPPDSAESFARVPGPETVALLTVGRMDLEGKKLIELMDGARRAGIRAGTEWRLTLLGEGPDMETVRTYAEALDQDRFSLPGFASDPSPWYQNADLYVSRSEAEGFGLSIAEAGVRGLPVVMWNCGGISGVLGECSGVSLVGSQEEFEDELHRLLVDRSARESMGAANRRFFAEKFSVSGMIDSYAELLRSLAPQG